MLTVRAPHATGPTMPLDAGAGPDLSLLAQAVADLVRALAPEANVRVLVEPIDDEPASPQLRPVPALPDPALEAARNADAPVDELLIDELGRTVRVDGDLVFLTRREFDLLAFLCRRRGAAISRHEVMTAIWNCEYRTGDRTIDVHVRRVRSKLGRHADRLTTLRGYGYRLD